MFQLNKLICQKKFSKDNLINSMQLDKIEEGDGTVKQSSQIGDSNEQANLFSVMNSSKSKVFSSLK
jgi:hypothetical protein